MRRQVSFFILLVGCAERPAAVSAPACDGAHFCEQACQNGDSAACIEAGRLYEYGHAGPRDPARALRLYERSCALENGAGCYNAAINREVGRGCVRDERRAAIFYREACNLGSRGACRWADDLSPLLYMGARAASSPVGPARGTVR
jgi:TPR repeat protein